METWSNEQVLKFIRVMWDRYRHEKEAAAVATSASSSSLRMPTSKSDSTMQSMSTAAGRNSEVSSVNAAASVSSSVKSSMAGEKTSLADQQQQQPKAVGPSDPATVVAAAKAAFEALGDAGGALLLTEEPQRSISDSSPMVSSDAVMLEKTPSGTIRVPSLDGPNDADKDEREESSLSSYQRHPPVPLEVSNGHISTGSLCTANGPNADWPETPVDPHAKRRNMDWLRMHFRSLNEMKQLPYVYADLLQLYRYFYSPVDNNNADDNDGGGEGGGGGSSVHSQAHQHDGMPPPSTPHQPGLGFSTGSNHPSNNSLRPKLSSSRLQRKISYRGLNNVMMAEQDDDNNSLPSANFSISDQNSVASSKRTRVAMSEHNRAMQPATKRARNGKPRIDYFPRIKAKIDLYLSSSKQTKALVLLRQLKFVETTMFHGGNPYCDQQQQSTTASCSNSSGELIATDAEVILIDML